jgi:hypothetical protein
VNGTQAVASDAEVALGAAAALGGGFAEAGGDESFGFEAVECRIDAADRDFAASSEGELSGERDAVCFVTEANDGEEKHEFELAEVGVVGHIFNIGEDIYGVYVSEIVKAGTGIFFFRSPYLITR